MLFDIFLNVVKKGIFNENLDNFSVLIQKIQHRYQTLRMKKI